MVAVTNFIVGRNQIATEYVNNIIILSFTGGYGK